MYIQVEKSFFFEMKRDVRMSCHEKEREQKDAHTKTRKSLITHPYIFVFVVLLFVGTVNDVMCTGNFT